MFRRALWVGLLWVSAWAQGPVYYCPGVSVGDGDIQIQGRDYDTGPIYCLTSGSLRFNDCGAPGEQEVRLRSAVQGRFEGSRGIALCPEITIEAGAEAAFATTAWLRRPLDDTGITWAGDYPSGNAFDCSFGPWPQDCDAGADAAAPADGDGHAGFCFTKLDAQGHELAADASRWACVRDEVTGLVWEVKQDDGGLHDRDLTYRWSGTYFTDWQPLVAGSNAEALCGFDDWRLPTLPELVGLVDYGAEFPAIDTRFFPNTLAEGQYWTLSQVPVIDDAWYVRFDQGATGYSYHGAAKSVRLVRGGRP